MTSIVEEYANTGFREIKKWIDDMNGKYDEDNLETIMYITIQDIDKMYDDLFNESQE